LNSEHPAALGSFNLLDVATELLLTRSMSPPPLLRYNLPLMTTCPTCAREVPAGNDTCPSCGSGLGELSAETRLFTDSPSPTKTFASKSRTAATTSFNSIDESRFIPGTILADRYRIVGLLGRGGMGEVYRADDLKLSQPVALKFLPDHLLSDGAALARFHREVRVARQVSHKNVCRVYDIAELDGHHFLSMEYIRGEELSSLLRRIGRLPADKAIEIARQLCAGLAAAHDRGVLHRDLKPANVMIDDDGNVRITDFGLAGLLEEIRDEEIRTGTPAYMSPEQLAGNNLTVRSDIYSLGLVLYELFTGKKAFDAPTLPQLLNLRSTRTTPTTPSMIVPDLDPIVERVVLRCIEEDPEKRPASALQVAAALPGGDPIAAALAAGETPSPEMVAAAPKEGTLRPAVAMSFLAVVLIGLVGVLFLADRVKLHRQFPLDKSPEVLQESARELIKQLGYTEPIADSTYSISFDPSYLTYLRQRDFSVDRWDKLKTGQPAVIYYWYRQSPRYLVPFSFLGVSLADPPQNIAGMASVKFDMQGRLIGFIGVPPQVEDNSAIDSEPTTQLQGLDWNQPAWILLFKAAGLDRAKFKPVNPRWNPLSYADTRAAWDGLLESQPDVPLHVEASAYRGKPVQFEFVFPWTAPSRQREAMASTRARIFQTLEFVLLIVVILGALWLAVRNFRLGLGDRRGAFRLALFVFVLVIISDWVLGAHHVPLLAVEFNIFFVGVSIALFNAGLTWLIYIALEPFLRARWPQLIISWTRLLNGDFRNPLVGRDVLIGAAAGTGVCLLNSLWVVAPKWIQHAPDPPTNVSGLLEFREFLAELIHSLVNNALFLSLALLFILVLFSIVLQKTWLAGAAGWVLIFVILLLTGRVPPIDIVFAASISAIIVFALMRFGLLSLFFLLLFFCVTYTLPMTTDFSAWYAGNTAFALFVLAALAIYGFFTSLGGQQLFTGKLLKE
jgi:serine/threonine-protein kinase